MNNRLQISIKTSYLKLKLKELNLAYEYALKKQEEKEAQKEKKHYENVLSTLIKQKGIQFINRKIILYESVRFFL